MKTPLLAAALICCLVLPGTSFAQSKKAEKKAPAPKSASEQAFAEFQKVRNVRGAKPGQPRFDAVIHAGIAFITAHPAVTRTNEVANYLGLGYPMSIDSKQPALRAQYAALLNLEVANQKYKEGVTDAVRVALQAVEAAAADFEVRMAPSPSTMATLREKIDVLAETPAGNRFLRDRERSYVHLLVLMNHTPRAEEHLSALAKHADKDVAAMARQELGLIELRKTPFDLKFTALDGKSVDFAALRGKVVALYFWSSTNKTSADQLNGLARFYSTYRKKNFEVVTVSYDKEADGEKLQKFVKSNRVAFPVYFDGKQSKNAFASKLNITAVPRLVLFDQSGMLQSTMQDSRLTPELPLNQLEPQVKKLLKLK